MLYSALVFGILGSFHCVGMCGPIAFMLPVSRDNNTKKFGQIFLYHFGRIFAYSLIGLGFGIVGKSLNLFGLQQYLGDVSGSPRYVHSLLGTFFDLIEIGLTLLVDV